MKPLPQISDAEYDIMNIIWETSPISTNEICEQIQKTHSWNPKTVHTLLKRLYEKSAVTYEQRGRMFFYSPLVEKDAYLKQESNTFLQRFYNGAMEPLLSTLLSERTLSREEITELKRLLDSCNKQ